jgi:RNA-directed DNA polymerase
MTTVQTVGAVSGAAAEWLAIDWQSVNRNVRRLQVRIVQAWKAGRWNKVKALQHLLTCSYSGKVLAVPGVTENAGKETPGVDGEIWDTPEKKAQAVHVLKRNGYRVQPLRRVYIPKKSDSKTMRPHPESALFLTHQCRPLYPKSCSLRYLRLLACFRGPGGNIGAEVS